MPDLSELDRAGTVKIAGGNPATGLEDNFMEVDSAGNAKVITTSAGPVTPGTAAGNSNLTGGQYNSALPTLTTGQQAALQVDSSGRLITVLGAGPQDIAVSQTITALDSATSSLTGANGQVFYFGSPTANSAAVFALSTIETVIIQANLLGGGGTLVVEVSSDGGTFWLRPNVFQIATQNYTNGFTAPFVIAINTGGLTHIRVRATVSWSGTATILVKESLNDRVMTIGDALPTGANTIGGVTQSGTWTVQPGNTQNTTPWLTTDSADGPVTPGAVASKSQLGGGQYNSTPPTLTTGQQSALQLNSSGQLLVAATLVDYQPATQNITVQDTATTTTAVANGQSVFTGTPTAGSTAAFTTPFLETAIIEVTGTWTGTLQIEVSADNGVTWSIRPAHQAGNSSSGSFGSFTANFTAGCNIGGYTNIRVRATTAMTGTAIVRVNESINTNSIFVASPIRISDVNNNLVKVTANGDIQTADIINIAGQYRAQSVTTTAAEALGAASILANRKLLNITPTNGTVYWGFNSSVTTANGTPIFKNTPVSFVIGSNVHIFLICAAGTVDCRIAEGS